MRSYVIIPFFVICLLLVAMSSVQANGNLTEEQQWQNFKQKFNRQYASPEEENRRKGIFLDHLREIREHNEKYEKGLVTYKKGVNQFADETKEEFQQKHTGFGVRH